MEKIITQKDVSLIAKKILDKIYKTRNDGATVITLQGELGSGKTTLTQSMARILGIKKNIISPTFVIMKIYNLTNKNFKQLIHIDAYRLKESSELIKLGFQKLIEDKNNLIIIEWPEQVPKCIPRNAYKVKLFHHKDETRTIKFED